jgi:hypothetical protein
MATQKARYNSCRDLPAGPRQALRGLLQKRPWIAGVVFLALAAVLAGCGSGGSVTVPSPTADSGTPGPATTVGQFLGAVHANNCPAAYALFSNAHMKAVSESDFCGVFQANRSFSVGLVTQVDDTHATVQAIVVTGSGDTHNDEIRTVKDASGWKVDLILVRGQEPGTYLFDGNTIDAFVRTDYAAKNSGPLTSLNCQNSGTFEAHPGDPYYCQYNSDRSFGVIKITPQDDGSISWATDGSKFAMDLAMNTTKSQFQQKNGLAINLNCASSGIIEATPGDIPCSFTDSNGNSGTIVITIAAGNSNVFTWKELGTGNPNGPGNIAPTCQPVSGGGAEPATSPSPSQPGVLPLCQNTGSVPSG